MTRSRAIHFISSFCLDFEWSVTATLDGIIGLALGLVLIPVVNKAIVPIAGLFFPEKKAAGGH